MLGMKEINRECPVCKGKESSAFMVKAELSLVKCERCCMVYANPVPGRYIDGTFYEDSGRPFYLSAAKLAGDFSPVRFKREIRLLRSCCKKGRILDVGCSTGAFLTMLKQQFACEYEVCGTDISGPPLDYAESKGVPVVRANFLTHAFHDQFDTITFWAVLEHVENPKAFVAKAYEILKPGGFCIILVPNLDSLAVRVLKQKYRYILPQHINYFTASTLRQLTCPPFEHRFSISTHFNPIVIAKDWRGSGEPGQDDRAKLLVKTNSLKQTPWLAPLRWLYMASEKILGKMGLADNCVVVLQK